MSASKEFLKEVLALNAGDFVRVDVSAYEHAAKFEGNGTLTVWPEGMDKPGARFPCYWNEDFGAYVLMAKPVEVGPHEG